MKVSLATSQFESDLPFNQKFFLRVTIHKSADSMWVVYGPATVGAEGARFKGDTNKGRAKKQPLIETEEVVFQVKALAPNQLVLFEFRVFGGGTVVTVPVIATPRADLRSYFDTDFGILVSPSPGPGYWGAGSNVHAYLVPINKNEPSNQFRGFDNVFKRVSALVGLSFVQLQSAAKVEDYFTAGNPVVGIGIRPVVSGPGALYLNFLRLNAGLMFYKQRSANPLIDRKVSKKAPFVSLTADFALQKVLAPIAAVVGLAK